MEILEPIIDLATEVVSSSKSPKGCAVAFLVIGVIIGIIALIIYTI